MSLPKDKTDKLVDDVAKDVYKVVKDKYHDLVKHEVPTDDAKDIIKEGIDRAGRTFKRTKGELSLDYTQQINIFFFEDANEFINQLMQAIGQKFVKAISSGAAAAKKMQ